MRRHSSIQLILLSLTGCSWMLLFLILTLSDYHAFKAYHAAHVAAAHTTAIPTPKEIDPCDLCWGEGRNYPKDSLQRLRRGAVADGLSGIAGWGVRLARAVGMHSNGHRNFTQMPPNSADRVGGIGAFYYYTLHTTFTSLRIRLKKAQQVAGDVHTEVATLEGKVASLQDILTSQFSPKLNPYKSNVLVNMGQNSPIRSAHNDLKSNGHNLNSHLAPGNAESDSNKEQIPRTSTFEYSNAPVNDIYALIYDQTQSLYSGQSKTQLNDIKDKYIKGSNQKFKNSNSFNVVRNILSHTGNVYLQKKDGHQIPLNETHAILNQNPKIKLQKIHNQIKSERNHQETIKCQVAGSDNDANDRVTKKTIAKSVSIVIIDQGQETSDFLTALAEQYPDILVHLVSSSSFLQPYHQLRVMVNIVPHNTSIGSAYAIALENVITQYVFIATNVSHIFPSISLEKLIIATEHLGVWAVSGALQTPSGKWHMGCLDMSIAHYKVSWTRRITATADGCSLCYSLEGSFLALTSALQYISWDTELPNSTAQLDLFLRASQNHYMLSAVCPQVLFQITHELEPPSKASLLSLAKKHSFYSITVPVEVNVKYTCDEVAASCSIVGLALPPCCRQELAKLVRFFMDTCDSHGLLCELEEGTLLGALKTSGVMPWERDADITFHTNNFTALGDLRDVFERAGYSLHLVDNRWCCVEGRWAGGQGTLNSVHWSLELYSQHAMDSEVDLLARRPRTRLEFDGSWVTVPSSPGLYARNRYGTELYRHAQHWLDTGRKSGWEEYEPGRFLPCSRPTHHACLDQYLPDGNLKLHPQCLV